MFLSETSVEFYFFLVRDEGPRTGARSHESQNHKAPPQKIWVMYKNEDFEFLKKKSVLGVRMASSLDVSCMTAYLLYTVAA